MAKHPILFYFPFNKTLTGGPRTLLTLVELLDKDKFYPVVVTQKQSRLVEELEQRNIEVVVMPLPAVLAVQDGKALGYGLTKKIKSLISLVRYNLAMVRFLKERNISLVWARNIKGVLFIGLAARFSKTALIWDIGLGDPFRGFVRLLHFIGLNLATLVITQGKSQHAEMFGSLLPRLYKRKLHFVLPGIDQHKMQIIQQLIRDRREKKYFQILSVGSVGPRKNQAMLLQAVQLLAERFPQIQVKIVGPVVDEAYYQTLQQSIQSANLSATVSFLGWRTDIPELMSEADVLVLCSYNEGIPRVVHEAMHSGLPVIATRVGGIPDAVVDGETGFLVAADDAAGLAGKLSYLIQQQEAAETMGARGKRLAQENFTYQAYYRQYETIFSRLITQHA